MGAEKLTIIKQSHGRRDGINSGINRDDFWFDNDIIFDL